VQGKQPVVDDGVGAAQRGHWANETRCHPGVRTHT
jgi:hypothetical protein